MHTTDCFHTQINQKIAEEAIKPDADPGVKAVEAVPLAEGYTQRFLNVIDGTNGRMSVRWGMKGLKGTNSSGLN